MAFIFAPSILSADFARLGNAVEMLDNSEADWVHIDVMDGRFVPNLTFGLPVIEKIRPYTNKAFDVHLMIEHPEDHIQAFKDSGADLLTVHYEACTHLHGTLQAIRKAGMKAGVALNPHTPAEVIEYVLDQVDLVLVMSVNPGYGGQKFIESSLRKLEQLQQIKKQHKAGFIIEIDGGIKQDNAATVLNHGAEALVAGSAVFNENNVPETIASFKKIRPTSQV